MSVIYVEKKNIDRIIKSKVKRARTIIDVGCGINPQRLIHPKVHICIEPYIEYVQHLMKNNKFENYVYINATINEAIKIFPGKSVDSIFMLDFIEHIEKDEGLKLLEQCERIAKKQIIVFTPLGFFPQYHFEGRKDLWGMNGGAFQEHKSGWDVNDFNETWDLFCVKEFHFDDGYGRKFENPFGIIWAIKNINHFYNEPTKLDFILHSITRKIPVSVKIFPRKVIRKIFKLLSSSKK